MKLLHIKNIVNMGSINISTCVVNILWQKETLLTVVRNIRYESSIVVLLKTWLGQVSLAPICPSPKLP